jgi:VacB/RNase II family 3'-5' exoribonuclease
MPITPAQTDELRRLASDAMRAQGFLPDFSTAALAEANAATAAAGGSGTDLQDLRSLLWSSVDNDESLDLDQIEVAEALPGGQFKLMVGIADVSSVVKIGSAIDEHARANTTSVYTAAAIFAMLPERLSTNLTSLAQDQDRLGVVMELTVSADGTLGQSRIYRALVRNRAKLAYRSVAAWLQGAAAPPPLAAVAGLDKQLRMQDDIAQALKRQRQSNGALEFDTAENRAVYEAGVLVDLQPDPRNRAQELIEEFMVAANGAAVHYLQQHGRTSLRRILRTPKRWDRIVQLAKELGDKLPDEPDAVALNAFLTKRRQSNPAQFADLSLAVIKCLGAGEYIAERPGQAPEGHFALALRDYTHSTAPNRRFPDLLTQRLLKAVLGDQPAPYSDTELSALATHCTEQEGNAKKVERQIEKSVAAMLLGSRIGVRFEGIVTGASEKGTWVRIENPPAEGRVVKGFQGFDVGDHVHVQLLHVDVARGFIDFAGLK